MITTEFSDYVTVTTKYHGPTNNKGSRISVLTGGGVRRVYSYRSELSSDENHRAAFEHICTMLGWKGHAIGANTSHSGKMVWVFINEDKTEGKELEHAGD